MSSRLSFSTVSTILIGAMLFIACTGNQPNRINYKTPSSQIEGKSWQQIFANSAVIDTFKILNTGKVKVPTDGMLNVDKLPIGHDLGEFLWVDVFVFLFHHQEKGWFLIDTGLDSSFQNKGNITGLLAGNYIKDTRQEKSQNIAAQLMKENKSISGIFFTHLHGDHTAGLPEIDPNIPKFVGSDEKYNYIPLLYTPNHLSEIDTLRELNKDAAFSKDPFDSIIDIFGDGSFLAIHTPGHSNSHLSFMLITSQGPVLMTGDASHTKYGFQHQIEPGWAHDRQAAEKSLSQLVKFHQYFPHLRIIYGHEK